MTECYDCEKILSENKGGILCILKRNRKYIIGFVVGCAVVAVILMGRKGGKHGK